MTSGYRVQKIVFPVYKFQPRHSFQDYEFFFIVHCWLLIANIWILMIFFWLLQNVQHQKIHHLLLWCKHLLLHCHFWLSHVYYILCFLPVHCQLLRWLQQHHLTHIIQREVIWWCVLFLLLLSCIWGYMVARMDDSTLGGCFLSFF